MSGTVDYEVRWDASAIESLARPFEISVAELDVATPVTDLRSLLVSILSFLRDGGGGERSARSATVLEELAARLPGRATLGGTGVRAALAMDVVGVPSTVHLVALDDTARGLLPARVSAITAVADEPLVPHVIVQFPRGASVRVTDGVVSAPRSNRIIYVNDRPNRELPLSAELDDLVPRADVLLISGVNAIVDDGLLADRVARLTALARAADGLVVFEDAGYHEPAFGVRVRDALAPVVDVYGLNEDELFGYLGASVDLLDADAVEDALRRAEELIPASCLVVHTRHWAAAVGERATAHAAALRGGVVMATTRYVHGDAMTADDYRRTAQAPPQAASVAFAAELERRGAGRIVCVPAFDVDTDSPTTVGLGDSFVGGFIAVLARRAAAGAAGADAVGSGVAGADDVPRAAGAAVGGSHAESDVVDPSAGPEAAAGPAAVGPLEPAGSGAGAERSPR